MGNSGAIGLSLDFKGLKDYIHSEDTSQGSCMGTVQRLLAERMFTSLLLPKNSRVMMGLLLEWRLFSGTV